MIARPPVAIRKQIEAGHERGYDIEGGVKRGQSSASFNAVDGPRKVEEACGTVVYRFVIQVQAHHGVPVITTDL